MIILRQKLYAELKDVGGDENKLKEIQDRQKKAQERKEFKAKKKANREATRLRAGGPLRNKTPEQIRRNDPKAWDLYVGNTGHRSKYYLTPEQLERGAVRKYANRITYPGLNQNITTKGELGYFLVTPKGDIKIETPRDFYEHQVKPQQTSYVKGLKRHKKIRKVKRAVKNTFKKRV